MYHTARMFFCSPVALAFYRLLESKEVRNVRKNTSSATKAILF